MTNLFFDRPILNSPYEYPARHRELDDGQSTQRIIEDRRTNNFVTPTLRVRKRNGFAEQREPADGNLGPRLTEAKTTVVADILSTETPPST